MSSPENADTDWNDIGSICRTFGREKDAINTMLANRIAPERNFWKEAADEIEQLRIALAHTRPTCPTPGSVVTDGSVRSGDIITYALKDGALGEIISHTRPERQAGSTP